MGLMIWEWGQVREAYTQVPADADHLSAATL